MSPKAKPQVKKIVLAYSGGLDTSVIVRWLIETYRCEVICFVANVGQQDDLEQIEARFGAAVAKLVEGLTRLNSLRMLSKPSAAKCDTERISGSWRWPQAEQYLPMSGALRELVGVV